jgi:phosphoglycerate-specific signal transduction histidine kinase
LRKVTTNISNRKQFFTLSLPNVIYTGFDVPAVETMKSVALGVVLLCSLKSALSFVGKYYFHIQGGRVSQSKKKQNQVASSTTAGFLLDLPFDTENGSDVSPNLRDLSKLHRATIHKIIILILNIIQFFFSFGATVPILGLGLLS